MSRFKITFKETVIAPSPSTAGVPLTGPREEIVSADRFRIEHGVLVFGKHDPTLDGVTEPTLAIREDWLRVERIEE